MSDLRAVRSFQFIFLKAERNFSIFTIKLKWICAFSSFRTEVSKRTRKLSCVPNHLTGKKLRLVFTLFSTFFSICFSHRFFSYFVCDCIIFFTSGISHIQMQNNHVLCVLNTVDQRTIFPITFVVMERFFLFTFITATRKNPYGGRS